MQKIVNGIRRFQQDAFQQEQELFENLAQGQSPETLMITCADSRIDPNLLTQTKPGELFIQRTAGNIVPPWEAAMGTGEAATIEYAVQALQVQDIIICGHSHCGAMGGLLNPDALDSLPAVKSYLEHASAARTRVDQLTSEQDAADQRLWTAIEQNVLVQLENLKTHPAVAAAVESGKLTLHGWVYQFESGDVFAHDPRQDAFQPLRDLTP